MRCRSARKLTFEFIDGLTDDTKRLELDKHLAECKECEKLASQLTRSMDLLHRAPVEAPEDNFAWKVRLKLNQELKDMRKLEPSRGSLLKSWNIRYAAAALGAFAVVVVAGLMWGPSDFSVFESGQPVAERSTDFEPGDEVVADNGTVRENERPGNNSDNNPIPYELFWSDRTSGGFVSLGGSSRSRESLFPPAIGQTRATPADFDSLVRAEMAGLSPEQRIRYLQQRLILLQRHLTKSQMENIRRR
jgi:hypothetical protein